MTTTIKPHEWQSPPGPGTILYDAERDEVGELQAVMQHNRSYWLRPVGGGREWDARLEDLHPADQAQELSAKVKAANERSRAGRWGN